MKIGFIGVGGMTAALASKWSGQHTLYFGGRDPEKAATLADRFQGRACSQQEALQQGDVAVLAVPAANVLDVVEKLGGDDAFAGKTLIDITNPIDTTTFLSTMPNNTSMTLALKHVLPNAHLAKAFNMAHTSVWKSEDMTFDGRRYVTLYTADDQAKDAVARLIDDTGSEPLYLGGNEHAYQLEAAAAMVIKFLFSGRHGDTVLNFIQPERKPIR